MRHFLRPLLLSLALFLVVCSAASGSANFTWSPAQPNVGEEVRFTDLSHPGGPPTPFYLYAWQWSFDDGTTSSERNPVHVFSVARTYYVTLKAYYTDGLPPAEKTWPVTVIEDQLQARFEWDPLAPKSHEEIRFVDRSTGSPVKWLWRFHDEGTSTQQFPSFVFRTAGTKVISLMVTNAGGQSHQRLQTVKVLSSGPPIAPRFGWSPTTPAARQPVTFIDRSTGEIVSWNWSFGDQTYSKAPSPTKIFTRPGQYRVTLEVSDGLDAKSTSADVTVAVNAEDLPQADFTWSPGVGTVGQPIRFYDRSSGSRSSYLWTFGDNTSSTQQNPVKVYAFAAKPWVSLTVTNAYGSDTTSYRLDVREAGKPPRASFVAVPQAAYVGRTVQFQSTSSDDPTSLSWMIAGGRFAGPSPSVTFTKAGTWGVSLTARNAYGESTANGSIVIADVPPPLQANFDLPPAPVRAGVPLQFTDASSGPPTGWQWAFGDGGTSDVRSPGHTFATAGEYWVSLWVARNGETSSARKRIIVEPRVDKPRASFVVRPGDPKVGASVTLADTSTGPPESWEWVVDGQRSWEQSPSWLFTSGGPHNVALTVTNDAGRDTTSRVVNVKADPKKPAVYSIRSRYGRCFFSNVPIPNEFRVSVNWRGETPATVVSSIDGVSPWPVQAGPDATNVSVAMGGIATPATGATLYEHLYRAWARNAAGLDSEPVVYPFYVFREPGWMVGNYRKVSLEGDRGSLLVGVAIPPEAVDATVTLPTWIPKWGGQTYGLKKTQWTHEYTLKTDCSATSEAKGETGLQFGKWVVSGSIRGGGELAITPTEGVVERKAFIGAGLKGGTEEEASLQALVPAIASYCANPSLKPACDALKLKAEIAVNGGLAFQYANTPNGIQWADTNASAGAEVRVSGAAKLRDNVYLEAFGGGQFAFTFGRPTQDLYFLRKFEFGMEVGIKANIYIVAGEVKSTLACVSERANPVTCGRTGYDALTPGTDAESLPLRPILPEHPPKGAELLTRSDGVGSDGTIVEKMFSMASPVAVRSGDRRVVIWVGEDAAAPNLMQRTNIHYAVRTGDEWSAPRQVTSDDRAEFSPQAIALPDGRVLAVWQRAKSATLTFSDVKTFDDLPKLNAQMELVASTYEPAGDVWSAAAPLTDDDLYDFGAKLALLSDGSALLTWIRDGSNAGFGSSAQPMKIVSRRFSANAWEPQRIIADGLTGVTTMSLAANGSDAFAVWTRDRDGDLATAETDLAYATFASGSWTAAKDFTADAAIDAAPTAFHLDGGARVVWLRDGALVMRATAAAQPTVVFAETGTVESANRVVTVSPGGRAAMVWVDREAGSQDVVVSTWDAAAGAWGAPAAATHSDAVESSLSAWFDGDALEIVGLQTAVEYAPSTVGASGTTTTVPRVAKRGDSSLFATRRSVVVALAALGMTATPSTPAAGETVRLEISARNSGDLSLRDVPLRVHAGRGTTGTVLANALFAGNWLPGETKNAAVELAYPAALKVVTALIDPDGTTGDELSDNTAMFGFVNAPPVACAQLGGMMGSAPLTVTFDASCSSDADGSIAAVTWIWPGGERSEGPTATRTFADSGTWPTTLLVTDDTGATTTRTFDIHVGSLADLFAATPAWSLHVPVAGRTRGQAGTFFVTDASLLNTSAVRDADIDALYRPDGRGDFYTFSATVPPGQLLDLPDVIARWFGGGSGTGWIRFDSSHPDVIATSRSYNSQTGGTAGTIVPAVPSEEALVAGETRVFLQDWRQGYRVNVGATEIGGEDVDVTFVAYDASGSEVGRKSFFVPAYGHIQVTADPLYQRAGRVEASTSGGRVIPYLTTVDGTTGDAVYQEGARTSETADGLRWIVPTSGRLRGDAGTQWRTDVRVYNATAEAQEVTVTLVIGGQYSEKRIGLAGGQTIAWDDVITSVFPELQGDVGGVLFFTAPGRLLVSSRTYNQLAQGTYGLSVPARSVASLPGEGEVVRVIQLRNDPDFRCNLGITSADEAGLNVAVRAFDHTGGMLADKEYYVGPRQNLQINRVFSALGVTESVPAGRIEVSILGGGRAYVYASVVDNKTGDGTFVEGR